jgi:hypothetical protein
MNNANKGGKLIMKRLIKAGSYWEDEELCERDDFG